MYQVKPVKWVLRIGAAEKINGAGPSKSPLRGDFPKALSLREGLRRPISFVQIKQS